MEKSNTTLTKINTHDLIHLNDIMYNKYVFCSQVNRLNARFPFVSSGVKCHLLQTYCRSFYGCFTWNLYWKHANQLKKTHRRLLPLIVNGEKSFKSQHCNRLQKYARMTTRAEMIKELLDIRDGINECLHRSRTETDDLIFHLCYDW